MNLQQLLQHSDRPFLSHPQVTRYFPAASIEDARRRLGRSIERGEGPGVVFGAAGTGKSMLLQVLAAEFHQRFDVVLLACAPMHTRRGLLQAIHFELGLDHQQRDEGELRLSLLDHLLSTDSTSHALLLLVDEAQSLPTQLIEEIRILGNLATNGVPRVRVVLAGLPSLEERLASPELESFSQRLTARCCLSPFARAETIQYAQAQVAICGADPQQIFSADVWDALFDSTDGVPRLVNQLCDRAMLLADDRQAPHVDESIIREAWADLQQLPSPSQESQKGELQSPGRPGVVEFGSLLHDGPRGTVELDDFDATDRETARQEPISYPVALSTKSRLDESADFTEPVIRRCQATPSVDEPHRFLSPVPQRCPRTHDDCVPVAVDPFADPFEEEEIVLDHFAPLSEIFHAGTPYVDNLRDRSFTGRVRQALAETCVPSGTRHEVSLASEVENSRPASGAILADRSSTSFQETIRLAVIGEAEELECEPPPQAPTNTGDFGDHAALRPTRTSRVASSQSTTEAISPAQHTAQDSSAKSSRAVMSDYHLSLPVATSRRAIEEPILLIEDEPVRTVRPQSGVRREAYRDLFSRLRHGT